MVKRGLKIFGIGAGTLVIIVGVIVGILFATGVLGKKMGGSTPPSPPSPPSPNSTTVISTTLSDAQLAWEHGGTNLPVAVNFNVSYNPDPLKVTGEWVLNLNITDTFQDGTTNTYVVKKPGTMSLTNIPIQPVGGGWIGRNRLPTNIDIAGYITYEDNNGNTVTGPTSNTISVNIPTKY